MAVEAAAVVSTKFRYVVTVETDTRDHADVVMWKVGYDEDLGFDYTIEHETPDSWVEAQIELAEEGRS